MLRHYLDVFSEPIITKSNYPQLRVDVLSNLQEWAFAGAGFLVGILFVSLFLLIANKRKYQTFINKKPEQKSPTENLNSSNNVDIPEHLNKEKQIRESEERFRWLVESSPNAIILTDHAGNIRLVNQQSEVLFGYERHELVGKSMDILLPERFRKNHGQYRKSYYNHPKARPMGTGRDLFGLHKLGNEIPVEIGLTPLQMQDKLMVLATIVDITERKKNEARILQSNMELAKYNEELKMRTAQLIQSEKMSALGTLVAGVAHELNNPLTGMLNYSQYCRKNVEPDSKIAGVLDDLIYETKRCEEIVKNLLQYSYSSESKEKEIILGPYLEQIAKRVSTLFAHEFKDIHLQLYIEPDLSGFQIENNKLQQIFSNLIKNAIDAMVTSPIKEITIRAFNEGDYCHLIVEDTGTGIDDENISRIFDPFYTTKEVGKGTGLGLSVTKSIVVENSGEIYVNTKPNEGTQVHLKFPVIKQNKQEYYEKTIGN